MAASTTAGVAFGFSDLINHFRRLAFGQSLRRAEAPCPSPTHGEGARLKACPPEDSLQTLFATFDDRLSQRAQRLKPVAIVAKYNDASRELCRWIEGLGTIGFVVSDQDNFPQWIASQKNELSCVIVDEAFVGHEKAYEFVAHLRMRQSRIAVVVLAQEDGSPDRVGQGAWPADAVLHAPIGKTGLKMGVLAAIENHEMPVVNESKPAQGPLRSVQTRAHSVARTTYHTHGAVAAR